MTALDRVFALERIEQVAEAPEEVMFFAAGYYDGRTPETQRAMYRGRVTRSLVRPLLRGADTESWKFGATDYILWTHDDASGRVLEEIPHKAQQYFESHSRSLRSRSDYREGMPLWQIFRVSTSKLGMKVAWQQLSNQLGAVSVPAKIIDPVLGESTLIPLLTAYLIPVSSETTGFAASAFLNSLPARAYCMSFAERARGSYFRFTSPVIGLIPLPEDVQAILEKHTLTPAVERMVEISGTLHGEPARPDGPTLHD